MNEPVFIAGTGAISAIGNDVSECLRSLRNSKAGIETMRYLSSSHKNKIPVGEVKLSNAELAVRASLSPRISRTALLSIIAAREAVADADIENFAALRTGFISATTVGGMDKTEDFFSEFIPDNSRGRLRDVVNHECGSITELVAGELGIKNYVSTISTACSSSANAIFFGARMIRHNMLDIVVAGGADAITRFTLNGFNTLMILDNELCKPFDENRKGLNLGEGAAYVVLVSQRVADTLKKMPSCKLSGYCNANDAYHQTASSPDGTGSFLAMQGALELSGLEPSDISYINLHGTGTQNNDIAEGTAISRLFDSPWPKMSSTKSFTGHTLGACGSLEAVFSAMAVQHNFIYPNLRFQTKIKELPFSPETTFLDNVEVKHALSNSFGFGGNCSSLIFSKL